MCAAAAAGVVVYRGGHGVNGRAGGERREGRRLDGRMMLLCIYLYMLSILWCGGFFLLQTLFDDA
jgi:hypothetical protein